jgi:hypothetical protein
VIESSKTINQVTTMKINLLPSPFVELLCAAALLAGIAPGYAAETDAGTNKSASPASPGSSSNANAQKAATAAAQAWLALVDDGNYSRSWKEAAAFLQGAVNQKGWEDALNSVRKPLGKLVSRKVKAAQYTTRLPGTPAGEYVVMQFETSFAAKGSAIETVTFKLEQGGKWKAAGYFIK